MRRINLSHLLEESSKHWPDNIAVLEGHKSYTYRALFDHVTTLSSNLAQFKFPREARVGLRLPDGVDYILLTLALWNLELTVVPIPGENPAEENSRVVSDLELIGIINNLPGGTPVPGISQAFYHAREGSPFPDNHGLNIAFIRFTSGTTHDRKGVVISHESLLDRIRTANQGFRITSSDTILYCLPMAHHFLITLVLYLFHGAKVVITPFLSAEAFALLAQSTLATVLYGTPYHYARLAQVDHPNALRHVRLAVSTTSPLSTEIAENFRSRFKLPISQGLGLIELGLVCLNLQDPTGQPESVGAAIKGMEIQIINPDASGCGELAVAGPGFFDAYAVPWIARKDLMPEGWFLTGDLGRLDEQGMLTLVGRQSAVINLAGRKIFPEEVETLLNQWPEIHESRVYGSKHPFLGEIVEADLVPTQTSVNLEALRTYCQSRLASYKIPVRFHICPALPKTTLTGKIIRHPAASLQYDSV